MSWMPKPQIETGYGSHAVDVANMLGTYVHVDDPDRAVIEPWASTVSGPILDVGAGTGRWTGQLAKLGHSVEGLEPVEELVALARQAHPDLTFHRGWIDGLGDTHHKWAGILAWYAIIHLGPHELPKALVALRSGLVDGGSLLMSFFSGPYAEAFEHPVTTAYRWPVPIMVQAVERAGFDVTHRYGGHHSAHAYIIARAVPDRPSRQDGM